MSVPLVLEERWVECLSQVKADSPVFWGFLVLGVGSGVDEMGEGKEIRIGEGTQGNLNALMSPSPHCPGRLVNSCGEWRRGERAANTLALSSLFTVFTHVVINQFGVCHFN